MLFYSCFSKSSFLFRSKNHPTSKRTLMWCHLESIFHKSLLVSGFLEHQYTDGFLFETFEKVLVWYQAEKPFWFKRTFIVKSAKGLLFTAEQERPACVWFTDIIFRLLSGEEVTRGTASRCIEADRKRDSCCCSSHPGRQEPPSLSISHHWLSYGQEIGVGCTKLNRHLST